MKMSLLSFLASPCCAAEMRFSVLEQMPREGVEIEEGLLDCRACGRSYPILGGIPRLLPPSADPRAVRSGRSFAYEWLRYPGSLDEDERVFREESQSRPEDFKDKLVLDAGCGMGRYALVALSWGAEVVALDYSESLVRLLDRARAHPRLHLVQGDLLSPPLRRDRFDFVYSHGVLHHTVDTRAAFRAVARLVKPRGSLSVWLYGRAGAFRDFSTNPLRADRAWVARYRRLAWLVVGARHLLSDILRVFTTRLPLPLIHALCVPLTFLGMVPGLKYLTFSVHPRFKVRLLENFDWLSPPFQHHHTKEELAVWCEEAGFEVVSILRHGLVPKPGVLARRRK